MNPITTAPKLIITEEQINNMFNNQEGEDLESQIDSSDPNLLNTNLED